MNGIINDFRTKDGWNMSISLLHQEKRFAPRTLSARRMEITLPLSSQIPMPLLWMKNPPSLQ